MRYLAFGKASPETFLCVTFTRAKCSRNSALKATTSGEEETREAKLPPCSNNRINPCGSLLLLFSFPFRGAAELDKQGRTRSLTSWVHRWWTAAAAAITCPSDGSGTTRPWRKWRLPAGPATDSPTSPSSAKTEPYRRTGTWLLKILAPYPPPPTIHAHHALPLTQP